MPPLGYKFPAGYSKGTLFSKETQDAILDAYMAGEKLSVIAHEFKCDPSYPCRLARRRGFKGRPKSLASLGRTNKWKRDLALYVQTSHRDWVLV